MSGAEQETLDWVRDFVVRLQLCPFAARPLREGRVTVSSCPAHDHESAFYWTGAEVQRLLDTPATTVETSLLVFPASLHDFDTFLDFVATLEAFLEESGADQFVQLAHFHPGYVFEGAEADDPANATNRAPYPTVQLLRTEQIARAVAAYADVEEIPARNAQLLRTGTRFSA